MAGQTMTDRLLAARHSLAGQGLAKSVCKATTEELIGPKKKHLDYLIHCTNEPNVSIPQLANLLIERSQNANWVVVFKALITVHHMMCYGNERFTQYLASSNSTFQLSNFLDKGGVQGARVDAFVKKEYWTLTQYLFILKSLKTIVQGYDMSPFIRRYAKYLNEKAMSYRTVAFDFCKVKRGKEDGVLRTMNAEKLLKTLPALQAQLDALLEFDCTAQDLSNGVINMTFMLLFRDLIRLFAGYNDSIINLLEKYFDMNKKQCREALDLYKKFLIRMDRVGEFLKVAENVGIDKGEIPDLTKAPSSLLDALEQHLAALEGKKGSAANTPTQSASHRTDVKSGVNALSSTSTAFGSAAQQAEGMEETLRLQALAEEEAAINHYKTKVQSPTSANAPSTNPFLITSPTQPILDLFASPPVSADHSQMGKASDDLLQLGNPFADMFSAAPAQPAQQPPTNNNNMWMSNGFNNTSPASNAFVSDTAFTSVFGSMETSAPAPAAGLPPNPFMGDFATPPNPSSDQAPAQQDLFGGNVDLFGGENNVDTKKDETMPLSSGQSPIKTATPPPPRPPPPASSTPRSNSPSLGKTAFDDLNDSIRMALGSPSPSRPPPPPQQTVPSAGFDITMQQPPVMQYPPVYGSPIKPGMPQTAPTAGGPAGNQSKVLTGDLDSSLASLAENLTINKTAQPSVKGGMQWNSPKNTAKVGGPTGWSPQPMAATTGANYKPMGQGMMSPAQFPQIQHSPVGMQAMGGMRMPASGVGVGGIMGPRQIPPGTGTTAPPPLDPFGAL